MKRSVSRFVMCSVAVLVALVVTAMIPKGAAQVAHAEFCSTLVSAVTCAGRPNPSIGLTYRDNRADRATSFPTTGGDGMARSLTLPSPGTSNVSPDEASRGMGLVSTSTTLAPNPTTAYTTAPNDSVVLTATVTTGATGSVTFAEGASNLT